jgi:tetraprenyl-beta-curcumene synthase
VARAPATAREGAAVISAFVRYRGFILPRVRRELTGWREAAALIPDPTLRGQALEAVTRKAGNAEATAILAIVAPRRTRPTLIRASTALQVAVDFLDSLGEGPGSGPDLLRDGLALHGALAAALAPGAEGGGWYAHHPRQEDGGYLDRLVATCRESALALPAAEAVLSLARRAAIRCGEGQSHTHAAAAGPGEPLRQWAGGLAAPPGFAWWEVAAGAGSSVAVHALLALAASPGATRAAAELVDAAYFPAIGALTVLLDDLVDLEADRATGEHNYLRYYPSAAVAAERLAAIAALARDSIRPLPHPTRHGAILTGILAYYLGSAGAAPEARMTRDLLLPSSGPVVRSLTRFLERSR